MNESIAMIERVAAALGALSEEVVFTGGAVVRLLVTDPAVTDFRVTDDVSDSSDSQTAGIPRQFVQPALSRCHRAPPSVLLTRLSSLQPNWKHSTTVETTIRSAAATLKISSASWTDGQTFWKSSGLRQHRYGHSFAGC